MIAPIVQEAKPYYIYLQSLRNISGQLQGTNIVLERTQQTQQVCPLAFGPNLYLVFHHLKISE